MTMDYNTLLEKSARKTGNIVCMGLDPILDVLPFAELPAKERIVKFFSVLFEKMVAENISPAAFKPNIGYYAILDRPREGNFQGSEALAAVLDLIAKHFPGIPVILDSKRGDIAKSSLNYAKEAFESWQTDSVTVSPYMGTDSVSPFVFEGKGMYVLDRTSNPGGADLQNQTILDMVDEHIHYPVYMLVAQKIASWAAGRPGFGAVVGATNMRELEDIAVYYHDKAIAMLIPGVGSQGGSAVEVVAALKRAGYPLELARINSSSGLTHPWKKGPAPDGWLDMCIAGISSLVKEACLS